MSSSNNHPPTTKRKSAPCRLHAQGHCRFGDKCHFSHDASPKPPGGGGKASHSDQPASRSVDAAATATAVSDAEASHDTSDARPRPKRGETPCRAWKAGTCTKGSKCRFAHIVDGQKPGSEPPAGRSNKQKPVAASCLEESSSVSPVMDVSRALEDLLEVERARVQEARAVAMRERVRVQEAQAAAVREHVRIQVAEAAAARERVRVQEAEAAAARERVLAQEAEAAAARERAIAIAREEAAKTISQVVSGAIVTYSAGLDVPSLITGFETCTLRLGNLALDVWEDDVHALLRDQGLDASQFHVVLKRKSDRTPEAHVVTDIPTGQMLALVLDGIEFQDEMLVVEMSATNSLEGMSAATGQSSDVLTISWRAPSARYVAEFADVAAANVKVKQLDRHVYSGRRIKVDMNSQPRGRYVPNLRLNAIKIDNLPDSVTNDDVMQLTGSTCVRRLPLGGAFGVVYTPEQIARLIRVDIEQAIPDGLVRFNDPSGACTAEGIVTARAHFSSWEAANTAHTRLSDKRYGNQHVWLRLPDPMHFTLVIPTEQYKAQKALWGSLVSSIKDRKACTLNVRESGNVVRIQLSGSVKEATGALKVRVENLARGDKVEGWHRSLGVSGNKFVLRVYSETSAYLRADWKRQSLKLYGPPGAIDRARHMIKEELDRLASLDYTVTLARSSVGFFVREGIQQLKETLGESNVKFAASSRKITVSGGEEARHALDRLITLSHKGSSSVASASEGSQTCPVCYDSVSSPHRLGCGHTYCVACLRHFISSALDSDQLPLACVGDEARCRVPIAIPTIQQFLPPTSFNRLLEVAFDAYVARHPEELKHCKTPDCTQIYRAAQAGAAPQALHCPSCFSTVCNGCHEDGHDGLSCAESKARRDPAEQERLNDAWIASQRGRVKKCPRCNVLIEKREGCNHMTCPCGAHICWRCMGVFAANSIYDHMNTAHGTIYDDLPEDPDPVIPVNVNIGIGIPVDIDEQRELLRQAEVRRAAALRNAREYPDWYPGAAILPMGADYLGLARREDEREGRERLQRVLVAQRQREAEERERRVQEQRRLHEEWERQRQERLVREAEERRRAQQQAQQRAQQRAQQTQQGGWGCAIM